MPLWTQQVEKTGIASFGYYMAVAILGMIGGIFGMGGFVSIFVGNKSTGVLVVAIVLFSLSGISLFTGMVHLIQAWRSGRQFRIARCTSPRD